MPKLTQSIIDTVMCYTQVYHHAPHQYQFRYYDTEVRAWRESQITNREAALRDQFETRVRLALERLGFEPDHAGMLANSAACNVYPMDWRQCVRAELDADALAKRNAA